MKTIIDEINKMSGGYHAHDIFQDWVTMMAISISNQVIYKQSLEDKYLEIAKKYTKEQLNKLCELSGRLTMLCENEIHDYLGEIYMGLNAGNVRTGQFFTPFHICELMAKIRMDGYDGKLITLNEPSCGGSGNILAFAKAMKEKGYNYQDLLQVEAQDLDFKCVYMSYVQLSLMGINAKVIQGDTLQMQRNYTFYTPMYVLKGGFHETRTD